MSIREKFTDIPNMHISFYIVIRLSTAANYLYRQKNHIKSVLQEHFQRPQDRNSFLSPQEWFLTQFRLSLDFNSCNVLLGTLFTWPLTRKRGSDRRLTEPHSLICSRGSAPKVSFLLLLLQCLFFQLVDELFSIHLKEWDRVLKQSRG